MRILPFLFVLLAHTSSSAIQYQCFVDEDCAVDEYCSEHRCLKFSESEEMSLAMSRVPECFSDLDCAPGETCDTGICTGTWPC